jgi:predicted small lipoprotein YifL
MRSIPTPSSRAALVRRIPSRIPLAANNREISVKGYPKPRLTGMASMHRWFSFSAFPQPEHANDRNGYTPRPGDRTRRETRMHCWARTLFYLVVAALGAASMIGACGQKGPLYLPEEPTAVAASPDAEVDAVTGSDVPNAVVPPPESIAPPDTP